MKATLLVCALSVGLAACGNPDFREAGKLEKLQRYPTAISKYEEFVRANPDHKKVPEAMWRIAEIYRNVLKDYPKARSYYERVIGAYGQTPWGLKAGMAYMDAPDYFPLKPGLTKKLGDSESGGEIMRTEESCEELKSSPGRFKIKRHIFAGDQSVGLDERVYEKKDRELREFKLPSFDKVVVLRYPAEKGTVWSAERDEREMRFMIESDSETVLVRAGAFMNCLKVRMQPDNIQEGWRYEYFAPDLGLILSSVATEQGETRIAELLSYEAPAQ